MKRQFHRLATKDGKPLLIALDSVVAIEAGEFHDETYHQGWRAVIVMAGGARIYTSAYIDDALTALGFEEATP